MDNTNDLYINGDDGNRKKTKRIIAAGIVAAVLICLGVATSVLFGSSPIHVKMELYLGQRFLDSEQYDRAISAFNTAIKIDSKCIDAYVGKLEGYHGKGSQKALQKYYNGLIKTVSKWDEDYLDDVSDDISYIVLDCQNIYADAPEKQFEILEKGMELTDENKEVEEAFVDTGIDISELLRKKEEYEESLAIYDKILEYSDDEKVTKGLTDCLNEYINLLFELHDYDRIKELSDKYGIFVDEMKDYREQAETYENYFNLLMDCLSEIAQECQQGDYYSAFEIMHTDRYYEVISYVDELGEIRAFETEYGKVGVYNVSPTPFGTHMIYYGDYSGEIRSGNGVWLGYLDGHNFYSVGEWTNDMPNGKQSVREWSNQLEESVIYRDITGSVINGLWDGPVTWMFEIESGIESFPVTFNNGKWVILYVDGGENIVCDTGNTEKKHGDAKMYVISNEKDNTVGLAGYDMMYALPNI